MNNQPNDHAAHRATNCKTIDNLFQGISQVVFKALALRSFLLPLLIGTMAFPHFSTAADGAPHRQMDKLPENDPALSRARTDFAASSTHFLENKGQVWDTEGQTAHYVDFVLERGNISVFLLSDGGMAWQFNRMHYPKDYEEMMAAPRHEQDEEALDKLREEIRVETFRMDMMLEGANPNATIKTDGRSADYNNYYNRDALDVYHFEKVTYEEVYPGIDWVVYTTEAGVKYDFVVTPGADPNQIQLRFTHHESLHLDEEGNLVHGNRMGEIIENAPVSYQNGREIGTRFVLENDLLRFHIDNYNPNETLTIDPARIWGTYYGAATTDLGWSCSTDALGNVYLAGETRSLAKIASGGHQNSYGGNNDAFLVKFNASGTRLWGTYYGGSGDDRGFSCSTDAAGNVYLAGRTSSTNNIASGGHQNSYGGGNGDAFLVKFNASGVRLWGTYYGGSSLGWFCSTDAAGNVYLAGGTGSTTNIASGGHDNSYGGGFDAFLVKFNASGTRLWGTYYGGGKFDEGYSCSTDAAGNVYLAGYTQSRTKIASGGHQNSYGGGSRDAFLVKFNASGTRLWGTYYGGTSRDWGWSCSTDAEGNVYLAGRTRSTTDIASGGHQNSYGANYKDAFLVKFNASGTRLWGTYYGGSGAEIGYSCSTDAAGNVYLAGETTSTTNIASGGHQNSFVGGLRDAFLVKFNASGTRLWGTYYGGSTRGQSCSTDAAGNVYLAGTTASSTNIASNGHDNDNSLGDEDAFLVKFTGEPEPCTANGGAIFTNSNTTVCENSLDQVEVLFSELPNEDYESIGLITDNSADPLVYAYFFSQPAGGFNFNAYPGSNFQIWVLNVEFPMKLLTMAANSINNGIYPAVSTIMDLCSDLSNPIDVTRINCDNTLFYPTTVEEYVQGSLLNDALCTTADAYNLDGLEAMNGCVSASGLAEQNGDPTSESFMEKAHAQLTSSPNPTNGPSQVTFETVMTGRTLLEVYDLSGRNVATLFNQIAQEGQSYRLYFDGSGLPNGVYVYRMTTESETIIEKFMIAR